MCAAGVAAEVVAAAAVVWPFVEPFAGNVSVSLRRLVLSRLCESGAEGLFGIAGDARCGMSVVICFCLLIFLRCEGGTLYLGKNRYFWEKIWKKRNVLMRALKV